MMDSKLIKFACLIVAVLLVCCTTNKISFAQKKDPGVTENIGGSQIKYLQEIANTAIDMLIASRNVIAKNQDVINRDPATGNYTAKGFVPAVVGSQIANDYSLMTGNKLKQTSLKVRNPSNAPDEWEKKILKLFGSSEYPKDKGFGEMIEANDKKIYRYIKPIYIDTGCIQCHGNEKEVRPEIRKFLESRYPHDQAFGYKEGDVRGGISITLLPERLNLGK